MKTTNILTLMLTIMALAVGQGSAQAQIFETTYTVTDGSSSLTGDESCCKLLDGDIHTKWYEYCGYHALYVEFNSATPFVPTGYILTTANDNTLNIRRNPESWKLYGKLNKDDADWTTLADVSKDESMDDKNFAPYEFSLNNPELKRYQYFKFEISDTRSNWDDYFQLSEFQFKGYSSLTDMKDAVVTFSQPVYNSGSPEVSYTVTDGLGTTIASDKYDASTNPATVSAEGQYTLTLTGKNGYSGTKAVTFWVKKQLNGAGTEESPYLISTSDDWNLFAERVRLGDTYKGKFVKLNGDIDVTTMAGSSEVCSFQGTFDGGGNTINVDLTATEDACAPFRHLKDATVKDLNIVGTVESGYSYAASLAVFGYGTCVITNCASTAEIRSTRTSSHEDYHGGFIAVFYAKGAVTFNDCIFAGKMTGSNSYGVCGFVGYNFVKVYYNHCLYAATEFTMGTKYSYTFNGYPYNSELNGAFVTKGIDNTYGTKIYANTDQIGKVEFDFQGTKYCTRAAIDIVGINSSYDPTGSVIDILPELYYDKTLLTEGTDYELATTPSPVQEPGTYTMTFTGKGIYAGVEKRLFVVNVEITGEGTAENPYLIPNSATWDCFAAKLNDGTDYTGKYFKLTDNFDNSASPAMIPAGTDQHPFKGIFLGNNRTLTIGFSGRNKYLAPFSYIEGAAIQDLTVTGTITSTVEGDGTHGGFAGVNNGNSTFTNCTFSGKMLGEKTNNCGGFVGWNNGNLTYTDCVFAPADITISNNGSATFNRNGKNTLTRCYYTTPLGEVQGVQVTTDANTVHAAGQILIGGVNYYRKCDVTGLKRGYSYSGDPIAVTPVVMFEGQKLTEDKDYTVNYKNSSDEDVMANELSATGEYTITITGNGDYTGTYTANFFILMPKDISGYVFQKGIDDEGEYYEISSVYKWNALGSLVAYVDNATKGLRFKLMNDISVTTMIGTNEDTRSFQGIFDGNGKTLTVTLSGGDDDKFLAPFRYTKAATIRNLTVAGSISSTRDGDGTHGGFVGINNNETTFENCVFTGSLLGDKANRCGGFVGWNNGTLHYIDCLFNPAEITMSSEGSATFNRNGNNDFVRTYYLTPFGEKQGTHVYASEVNGIVSSSTTAADGNTYYIAMYYTIASEKDWKALAQLVLNDQKDDLPVELLDNITVTTSIGTRYHPFCGKFLGNGKTLTVNLNAGEDDQFLAPFSHVRDATFSNLTVAGTITSTVEGDGTHGGFVGVSNGNTSFEKCIFTGSLLGDKTNCCGGFVGWNNSRLTFTDCLFAPTEITMSSKGSATFNCNYDGTFVRTYFLTPFGEKQGKQAFTSSEAAVAEGVIIAPITFFNGDTYYVDCGLKTDNTIAEGEPGHFYINMSDRDLDYYTIPSGVTSLKIYDNGGKDGNASHNCDSKLVLSVPEGCLIQTSGTVFTYDGFWDYLYIYDGDSYYSSDCLGKYQGAPATVGPLISSKEAMRFYFACWDDNNKCNVDLTVNIINLKLDDKLDNTSKITAQADSKVNAILTDRTLYKDGDWNTLCLPFAVGDATAADGHYFDGTPLEGATVKELAVEEKFLYPNSQYLISENGIYQTGYDASTGTLSLYFKEATSIEAGKPYLIKWPQAIPHIKNPVFTDVTVTATTPSTITSTDGYVSFVGTYSPTDIFSADKTNLYIGADNTLYYPWADNMEHFYINSCRGYFQLNKGLTAGDPSAVKEFRLNFGDEDDPDGIGNGGIQNSKFKIQNEADAWYTLDGRKLQAKPTQRGIYIHNGEKIAIK